jgi:DNA repair exonuclease SbcCD ATPase subunit
MLNSIHLINFQGHLDSEVNFVNGLNVIYGLTDSGKSSIIKGLKLIVTNRPAGNKYIYKKKKHSEISIDINNFKISKYKTKSKNEYRLNETVFKAVRSSVPEEVSNAINLSNINIQSQGEIWFLIDKSPGHINQELNKLIDLSVVDTSLKDINSRIRTNNTEYKVILNDLEEIKNELDSLKNIEAADRFLIKLEKYTQSIQDIEQENEELNLLLNKIVEMREVIDTIPDDKFFTAVNYFKKMEKVIWSYIDRIKALKQLIDKIEELNKAVNKIDLNELKGIKKLYIDYVYLEKHIEEVLQLVQDMKSTKIEYTRVCKKLKKAEYMYRQELKSLGKCPTCGTIL